MELPILAALTSGEITEALRDYVLRKNDLDPRTVCTTAVNYNFRSDGGVIAAVHLGPKARREEDPPKDA